MIPAASTCPRCFSDVLALDPQPLMDSSKPPKPRSDDNYLFSCGCGKDWISGSELTRQHYRFLVKTNLLDLRPKAYGYSLAQEEEQSGFLRFIRSRVRDVMNRLQ